MSGAASRREIRPSQLLFHWQSRFCQLRALTGQDGLFTPFFNGTPGLITGRNGTPIVAGRGQPRWGQTTATGLVTRLLTEGEEAGQDSENIVYGFPLKVSELSLFWRVYPMYTVGQNVASVGYGLMIGSATTGGGWIGIRRLGTDWQVSRKRGGTEILSTVTDVGSVFPIDVLATLAAGGVIQLSTRSADGVIRTGATATDANMLIATEVWGGSTLSLCGVQGLVAAGGRWRHEMVKVARGVKTFSQMDAMS